MKFTAESALDGQSSGPHRCQPVAGPSTASLRSGEGNLIHSDAPGLSYVNPKLVEKLRGQLRAQTSECVMETFGISANTWVKMRKGMPIRKSVAERLLRRIGAADQL